MTQKSGKAPRRMRGFERTAGLLSQRIRKAGEKRGFAVARLLTHWEEIVGEDIARAARPVKVSYAERGFGATLVLLVPGAQAPLIEMQKARIRERVNACYGYAAIARVRITQTAPVGFADEAESFDTAPKPAPAIGPAARAAAEGVADPGLRQALEALGQNVISHRKR